MPDMDTLPAVRSPAAALVPQTVDQAIHMADQMAAANLMPDHLKGNPGN